MEETMIRLLILALIIYAVYRYLKPRLGSSVGPNNEVKDSQEAELIKDPECGAYFLKNKGVSAWIDGKAVFFCSESCRDAYLDRRRKETEKK